MIERGIAKNVESLADRLKLQVVVGSISWRSMPATLAFSNECIDNANYGSPFYKIGSPYRRTVAGEFELSDSSYGKFDQAGNVWEWTETKVAV